MKLAKNGFRIEKCRTLITTQTGARFICRQKKYIYESKNFYAVIHFWISPIKGQSNQLAYSKEGRYCEKNILHNAIEKHFGI